MTAKLTKQDEATITKAMQLIAENDALKPTAALRKLGLRSEDRIKRLSRVVKQGQAQRPAKQEKAAKPGNVKNAALRASGASSVKREPAPSPVDRAGPTSLPYPIAAQFDFWKAMMRWTPLGVMTEIAIANNKMAMDLIAPKRSGS